MRTAWQPEFYWAPQRRLDGGWQPQKDSPSPPPAPDYTGAATATSQGSVQAAIANNLLNMRNTNTPLGSQTFTPTGSISVPGIGGQPGFDLPQFSTNINMTPEGQKLYSGEVGLQTGEQALGQGALDRTTASLSRPFDQGSVRNVEDTAYQAFTNRLDPQWQQRKEQFDAQMANQGIVPGSEAYKNAYRDFSNARNDAYSQAQLGAIQTAPQTYQLATATREQPLTELNSIMSGTQPQMPQFQATPSAGGATGPNYLGAAQATTGYNQGAYNAQVGQNNAMMSGLFGLGGAALAAPTGTFSFLSDERLKKDIHKVADDPRGFGIHTFRYKWDKPDESPRIGVMAQEVEEVMPEAVFSLGGVKRVDYARL